MKKKNVIKFLNNLEDNFDIAEIKIDNGVKKDYIEVRFYDEDKIFRTTANVYERNMEEE